MHGQLPRSLDGKLVSYRWLKYGDINPLNAELNPICHLLALLGARHILHVSGVRVKGETESTVVAAQDQAISTNYFKNKILKEEIESKCRLCKQHEKTIDHLTSGCPILIFCIDNARYLYKKSLLLTRHVFRNNFRVLGQ
jgi:hypothetical protein